MKKLYAFVLLTITIISSLQLKAQVNANDSLALIDLYNQTHGKAWFNNKYWLTASPLSKWYGITVNENRVVSIDLPANNLKGKIPLSIGNLANLVSINLGNNHLNGHIPKTFGNLSKLTELDLYYNDLSGFIPQEFGNLLNLRYLFIFNNQLSGHIPVELGNLTSLNSLALQHNMLSGPIPATLENLKQLYYLYLNNNKLTGSIPSALGNMTSLNYLYLHHNELSGNIPLELANLQEIYRVDLQQNKLTGQFPQNLLNADHLEELILSGNRLTGAVPVTVKPALQRLFIKNNHFCFDGIEILATRNFNKFFYQPQRRILINRNNNTLSVHAGGTLANNTYKWYNNGGLAATITGDSTYTPTANGNYSVNVTNSVATLLTLFSDTVSFSSAKSSALTASSLKQFSVYPNPAKTFTIISFKGEGNYIIRLNDENGNLLQTKNINAIKGLNTVTINLYNYAAGLYFITLIDDRQQMQTLQLNKQ